MYRWRRMGAGHQPSGQRVHPLGASERQPSPLQEPSSIHGDACTLHSLPTPAVHPALRRETEQRGRQDWPPPSSEPREANSQACTLAHNHETQYQAPKIRV